MADLNLTTSSGKPERTGELTEDGKYYIIDNVPVAGEVHLLKDWVDQLDPDDSTEAINRAIAAQTATHLKERGVEFPTSYVFDQSFQRSATDIVRGITESVSDQRTTTPEDDMWDAIYAETNFGGSLAGVITGAIFAPENVVAPLISVPQKLGKVSTVLKKAFESESYFREAVKKDTVIGTILGGLAAERPEYGQDFASNAMWGGIGGFGFGLLRGGFGRNLLTEEGAFQKSIELAKLGVPEAQQKRLAEVQLDLFKRAGGDVEKIRNATDEQLQDPEFINILFENMEPEGVQAFDRFFGTIAEELGSAEQSLLKQGAQQIDPTAVEAEFRANLAREQADTADFQRRQYEQDFNTNLQRIQSENQQRLANQFNENLQRNQQDAQKRAVLNNKIAEGEQRRTNVVVRQEMAREINASIRANSGAGTVADAQRAVTNLQRRLDTNRRQLTDIRDGKRTPVNEDTLLSRRVFFNENLQKAEAKLEAAKKLREDRKKLAQIKSGRETPEIKARVDAELAKVVRREERPVPEVRPPEAPRNIRTVAERQVPEGPRVQMTESGIPVPNQGPVQPPTPQLPRQTFQRAPLQQPSVQTPQSVIRSALGQFAGGRSGGAAQVNPLAMPSGAAQAATMNTRSKAARDLPDSTQTSEGIPLYAGVSNAERVRLNAVRSDAEVLKDVLSIDGYGTGKYDFDAMTSNADDVARRVEEGIDEGNYRSAAQWLADTMMDGDQVRILTPAEKIFAARVRAVAESRLADMQSAQRQLMRDGSLNARSVGILNDMQLDKELSESMDELANIISMTERDATNTAQALSAMRKANKDYLAMREKLRRGSFIDQLFYGVTC